MPAVSVAAENERDQVAETIFANNAIEPVKENRRVAIHPVQQTHEPTTMSSHVQAYDILESVDACLPRGIKVHGQPSCQLFLHPFTTVGILLRYRTSMRVSGGMAQVTPQPGTDSGTSLVHGSLSRQYNALLGTVLDHDRKRK